MPESLANQWRTQLHTLPSDRQVRLRRFDLAEAKDLVGDLAGMAVDPQTASDIVMRVTQEDPERLLRVVTFLLQRGVAEPRIVPKVNLADLAEDEIRFQDVGEDLGDLLMAIARFNEFTLPEAGPAEVV